MVVIVSRTPSEISPASKVKVVLREPIRAMLLIILTPLAKFGFLIESGKPDDW